MTSTLITRGEMFEIDAAVSSVYRLFSFQVAHHVLAVLLSTITSWTALAVHKFDNWMTLCLVGIVGMWMCCVTIYVYLTLGARFFLFGYGQTLYLFAQFVYGLSEGQYILVTLLTAEMTKGTVVLLIVHGYSLTFGTILSLCRLFLKCCRRPEDSNSRALLLDKNVDVIV